MRCVGISEQLSAYLDGELDAAATRLVAAHLQECARCRIELARLREVVTLVTELPEEEPPADLVLRLRAGPQRVARRPAIRWGLALRPLPLAWGVGAVALVLVAWGAIAWFRPAGRNPVVATLRMPTAPSPSDRVGSPDREIPVVRIREAAPRIVSPAPVVASRLPAGGMDRASAGTKRPPAPVDVPRAEPMAQRMPDLVSLPSSVGPDPVLEVKGGEPRIPGEAQVEMPRMASMMRGMGGEPALPGPEPILPTADPGRMMATSSAAELVSDPPAGDDPLLDARRLLQERNRMIPQPPVEDAGKPARRTVRSG